MLELIAEVQRPGQQRLSVLIQKLLGYAVNNLKKDVIASLAVNHYAWRKFVVACPATDDDDDDNDNDNDDDNNHDDNDDDNIDEDDDK